MDGDGAALLADLGLVADGPDRWTFRRGPAELVATPAAGGWAVELTVRGRRRWAERAADPEALRAVAAVGVGSAELFAFASRLRAELRAGPAGGRTLLLRPWGWLAAPADMLPERGCG